MKLNDPRIMLTAGLALALNLSGLADGGDSTSKKSIKLVKAQTGAFSNMPSSPQGMNALTPSATPLSPVPDPLFGNAGQGSTSVTSQSTIPDPSPVVTVPMQMGTQPPLGPTSRPPMGLYYGEQDRLDAKANPSFRNAPGMSYSAPAPMGAATQSPMSAPGSIVNSYPMMQGTAVPIDGSSIGGAPNHGMHGNFDYAPPSGTLGQTYQRRSRPIEDTKHPRVGVVEVNLPESVDVTAKGLKTKWTGTVWRLESDSLIPGVPHIYEVKASWGEGTPPQVRTVRLIMGRIVDLDF